jgi:hypothetical protein
MLDLLQTEFEHPWGVRSAETAPELTPFVRTPPAWALLRRVPMVWPQRCIGKCRAGVAEPRFWSGLAAACQTVVLDGARYGDAAR